MKRAIVIVAGGSGKRMGTDIPKQFLIVGGKPVLASTIERFHTYDAQMQIVLVLPQSQIAYWHKLTAEYHIDIKHQIVSGGETRFHSVKNGLSAIKDADVVGVHDGVRPLVSTATIDRCFDSATQHGSAVPVMPSVESVRFVDENGTSHAVDRARVRMVQTPQVFRYDILTNSYQQPYSDLFTDDASVVEAAGYTITLVDGNKENIKLTTPDDLVYAEMLMAK